MSPSPLEGGEDLAFVYHPHEWKHRVLKMALRSRKSLQSNCSPASSPMHTVGEDNAQTLAPAVTALILHWTS